MISPDYVRTLARYNRWQNGSIYRAASTLPDEARRLPRGAYFGSIHATLNHLLWGDQIWMRRFAGTPKPKAPGIKDSIVEFEDWEHLKRERIAFDGVIIGWADSLENNWLLGDLSWYSGAAGREITKPRWLLVTHMFNHQTHHRGQGHAMLTAAGAKPDDTDLPLMAD